MDTRLVAAEFDTPLGVNASTKPRVLGQPCTRIATGVALVHVGDKVFVSGGSNPSAIIQQCTDVATPAGTLSVNGEMKYTPLASKPVQLKPEVKFTPDEFNRPVCTRSAGK